MSTGKTLADAIITQNILDKKGVATLRTSPSRGGTFGQNGLDAEALKQKFDELPEEIAKNVNLLIDILIAGKVEEAMAFVNSLADGDGKKRAVDILNALTVIGDALAYNGKALATQGYTDGKVEDEASARADGDAKKLDKVTLAGQGDRVYAVDNTGENYMFAVHVPPTQYTLACRTTGGALLVGTAKNEADAVPFKQMQDAISAEASARDEAIRTAISNLVGAAPDTLNTLAELATALKEDPAVVATLESAIAKKASKEDVDQALAGKLDIPKNPGSNKVLVSRWNNAVELWGMQSIPTAGEIAMFSARNTLLTNTATDNRDAVNLGQMNEALEKVSAGASADLEREVGVLTKKVANLEAGVADDMFTTDDTTAYIKPIPANAAPYAELRAVGGMIHAHELPAPNLFAESVLAQEDGETYDMGDGYGASLGFDSTRGVGVFPFQHGYGNFGQYYETQHTIRELFPEAQAGKRYTLSFNIIPDSTGAIQFNSIYVTPDVPFTMTEDMLNGKMQLNAGTTFDGYDDSVGDQYYSNISLTEVGGGERYLTEAKVTALDIYGRNLYNGGFGGTACTTEENGVVTIVKRAGTGSQDRFTTSWLMPLKTEGWSISVTVNKNTTASGLWYGQEDTNGDTKYGILCQAGVTGRASVNLQAPTEGANIYKVFLLLNYNEVEGTGVVLTDIMISPATTATTFSPYHKHTFAIPESVQALDGYGWGIPSSTRKFYNSIEWDDNGKATFVKRVGKAVYNGTESWGRGTYQDAIKFEVGVPTMKPNGPILADRYHNGTPSTGLPCAASTPWSFMCFPTNPPDTVAEWKALLAEWYAEGDPLTVYYELKEPIVTDISHLITDDNLIPVEGGGVIVAQNENEEAAPSTIIYPLRA